MNALGNLLSSCKTMESTALCNSYTSLVPSNLQHASITQQMHANLEQWLLNGNYWSFFRGQFCQRYSSRQWDCQWVTNAVLSGSVFHWEGTIHKSRWKKSGLTGIYFHKFAFYLDSFSELCSNDSIILCFQIPSSSLGAPLHATPVSFFFSWQNTISRDVSRFSNYGVLWTPSWKIWGSIAKFWGSR